MNINLEPLVNQVVNVRFYDHIEGNVKNLLVCRVWGKVVSYTDQQVVLLRWEAENDPKEHNEYLILVRSAIIAMEVLS